MGKLETALALVDRANAPNADDPDGRELLYGQRMSAWLARLEPGASDALQIACRAQHIRRWEIPRSSYPAGKVGYKKWRSDLARRHAELASAIAVEAGYDAETAERVASLVRKLRLKSDAEAQTLEDVACLVFVDHYLADFAAKHPRDKVVDIIAKTTKKMSARGLEAAGAIELSDEHAALLADGLAAAGLA